MSETILVALVFVVLLGLEWRKQIKGVRLGTAMLSLMVFLLAQPDYTTAARRVSVAPPEERITQLHGLSISEYESGVTTMYAAMDEASDRHAAIRLLMLGVLLWLACSPARRRTQRHSDDPTG